MLAELNPFRPMLRLEFGGLKGPVDERQFRSEILNRVECIQRRGRLGTETLQGNEEETIFNVRPLGDRLRHSQVERGALFVLKYRGVLHHA